MEAWVLQAVASSSHTTLLLIQSTPRLYYEALISQPAESILWIGYITTMQKKLFKCHFLVGFSCLPQSKVS